MYIIPAIDIIDGKCVRLTQGDYQQKKVYNEHPLEVAKAFEDAGIEKLHVVDLDGAKAKKIINYKTLEAIASKTDMKIDFGGGLKSDEDLHIAFDCGAAQVTIGTIAVKNPDLFLKWLMAYSAEKIILGADFKAGKIAVNGWQEASEMELFEFIGQYRQKGIQYTICTDISKDGLLAGSAVESYESLIKIFPKLSLIASGGVTSVSELEKLKEMGCYGAIVGKAIYEGKIDLKTIERLNLKE